MFLRTIGTRSKLDRAKDPTEKILTRSPFLFLVKRSRWRSSEGVPLSHLFLSFFFVSWFFRASKSLRCRRVSLVSRMVSSGENRCSERRVERKRIEKQCSFVSLDRENGIAENVVRRVYFIYAISLEEEKFCRDIVVASIRNGVQSDVIGQVEPSSLSSSYSNIGSRLLGSNGATGRTVHTRSVATVVLDSRQRRRSIQWLSSRKWPFAVVTLPKKSRTRTFSMFSFLFLSKRSRATYIHLLRHSDDKTYN